MYIREREFLFNYGTTYGAKIQIVENLISVVFILLPSKQLYDDSMESQQIASHNNQLGHERASAGLETTSEISNLTSQEGFTM